MSTMHTATSGPTLTQRYGGKLGFSGKKIIPPPGRLFGMAIGRYGSGKTSLFESNPKAYIMNCDKSSVLQPDATVWPVMDSASGRLIDADGTPIILTYEKMKEKRDLLVQMAKDNVERPETIVVDTTSSFRELLRDYCVRNARTLGLRNADVTQFKDLDGRAAYDWMYNEMLAFPDSLRAVGYGFYYVAHITQKHTKTKVGEEIVDTETLELAMTDSLSERLYPMFEMVVEVQRQRVAEEVESEIVVEVKGVKHTSKKKSTQMVNKFYLLTRNDNLPDGRLKPRVQLPDSIALPATGAWAVFEKVYLEQAAKA